MPRREFLALTTAAASSALCLGPDRLLADESQDRRLDKVGIQLYTVRDQMAIDVPHSLERLAAIGYDEVEFAGYYEHSPVEIRSFLNNNGLAAPSAHTSLQAMRSSPQKLIETTVAVGHDYLVLAWLGPDERENLDQYRSHAELCNRFAEQCRSAGVQFAYHNHAFEFETIDGVLPMDLLLAETDPELVQIELDLYWITAGGANPFDYFEKHPGRFPLCHVKDMADDGAMADVGDGSIDFAEIFAASDLAGLKHYFVERDDAPDSIVSATNSFGAASAIRF